MSKKLNRFMNAVVIGFAGLLLLTAVSAASDPPSARDLFPIISEGREFNNPRFSPDGRWLAFDLCEDKLVGKKCQNVIYDIPNDRYFAWRDAKGRSITQVSFSPDSTKAVFVVETNSPFLSFGRYEHRLAVGNIKEGRYRFITPGPGIKYSHYPEFWKDGTLIYFDADPGDTRGVFKFLYVVEPGKPPRKMFEQGLYAQKGFYGPSRPRPHWDGVHLVMAEYGFTRISNPEAWRNRPPGDDGGDEIISISPADGTISVLDIQRSANHRQSFSRPVPALLARQIYAVAILKEESKQARRFLMDVFIIDGGAARRVSRIAEYIAHMDVNQDGTLLAVITVDTSNRKMQDYRLLLYDPRNHARRYLNPKDVLEQTIQLND